ncbi:MAG TPA: DUF4271 domain-containing protein [Chitinophagaceae bacterium]|nr:DUF4271 domain-containing protein [Chitinophagaceae bacterium]
MKTIVFLISREALLYKMIKQLLYLLIFLFAFQPVTAQSNDSVSTAVEEVTVRNNSLTDKSALAGDTVAAVLPKLTFPAFVLKEFDERASFLDFLLSHNVMYGNEEAPKVRLMTAREDNSLVVHAETVLFYILLGVFLFLAIVHSVFRKYFRDLFTAFFSPTLSRRQLKDQLHQTPFPGFMLNLFFAISMGLYLFLVLINKDYLGNDTPVYTVSLFILFFIIIYCIKYLMLRFLGWVLKIQEIMDGYIFTVFLINKILGVVLLPFILVFSFSARGGSNIMLDISIILLSILFIYRYLRIFPLVRSLSKINKFHFFLYLCALEIVPILIIGKTFLILLKST